MQPDTTEQKCSFNDAMEETVRLEGGWAAWNTKGDKGGTTYAGLSRYWTLTRPLEKQMPIGLAVHELWKAVDSGRYDDAKEAAVEVYRDIIWNPLKLQEFPDTWQHRWSCFDAATLYGAPLVALWVQGAVGADMDYKVGPQTLGKVRAYNGDINDVIRRGSLVRNLAIDKDYAERFIRGWNNRAEKRFKRAVKLDDR